MDNMEVLGAKDIKKLSRGELLEMMLIQANELDRLQAEVDNLQGQLKDRQIAINKAGTMAEAAILINNVIQKADLAAKDYLVNIERLSRDADRIAQAKFSDAQREADTLMTNAKQQSSRMMAEAKQKSEAMVSQAAAQRDWIKRESYTYWAEISTKMETFYRELKRMREILNSFGKTYDNK